MIYKCLHGLVPDYLHRSKFETPERADNQLRGSETTETRLKIWAFRNHSTMIALSAQQFEVR